MLYTVCIYIYITCMLYRYAIYNMLPSFSFKEATRVFNNSAHLAGKSTDSQLLGMAPCGFTRCTVYLIQYNKNQPEDTTISSFKQTRAGSFSTFFNKT